MRRFWQASVISLIGCLFALPIFAIVVIVPPNQGQEDVIVTGPTQIQGDESTFYDTIQIVNKYLWFSIGAVCMGVLIFGGIKLMTAQGDQAKMKEANKLLLGALVGIIIAVFSYTIVRIIVNLL